MHTSPHKHQFCVVLFSWLPFKFTRLYWSCFVVRVFRFTWFWGIRLVNDGFLVVAGYFYSPGSACFMYLFLCFNICRFAIPCVICIQFGVLLFPSLLLLSSTRFSTFFCPFSRVNSIDPNSKTKRVFAATREKTRWLSVALDLYCYAVRACKSPFVLVVSTCVSLKVTNIAIKLGLVLSNSAFPSCS